MPYTVYNACIGDGLTQLICVFDLYLSLHSPFEPVMKSSYFSYESTCLLYLCGNIDLFLSMFISYYLPVTADYLIIIHMTQNSDFSCYGK